MKKVILFCATGFCSGYIPVMPGTFGTLAGMIIVYLEYSFFGSRELLINAAVLLLLIVPGIIIAGKAEKYFMQKDAPQIVIDEMLGYWLAVLFHPFSIPLLVIAFVLFRIFDIFKPYPVYSIQKLKGGLGVVADDLIAGVYVNVIIVGLRFSENITGVRIL